MQYNKFESLSDLDKQLILNTYNKCVQSNIKPAREFEKLARRFNCTSRSVYRWLHRIENIITPNQKDSEKYIIFNTAQKHQVSKNNVYIITWAQNNTSINDAFFDNVKKYAEFRNAEIIVIAGRYHNPNTLSTSTNESWDNEVLQYLTANRHIIHNDVTVVADVPIQPTAAVPLSGMTGLCGLSTCIFGHPKVQLDVVPTLNRNKLPKIILTTGACTYPNYTESKAGKKGEFHHTYGFCIVEVKNDDIYYIRQVTASADGDFYDLWFHVYKDANHKTIITNSCESPDSFNDTALIMGDLHTISVDKNVLDTTYNKLIRHIKPNHVVLHDTFDGYSCNHHNTSNTFIQYNHEIQNTNSIQNELDVTLKLCEELYYTCKLYNNAIKVIITRGNHDRNLDIAVDDFLAGKGLQQLKNLRLLINLLTYKANNLADAGLFPAIVNTCLQHINVRALGGDESYVINGWECGQHGDVCSNGTKGNIWNFRKLNTKICIGHSHTPRRYDGAVSVGCSCNLNQGYNANGPSTWIHAHAIIHPNGKIQHIIFNKDNDFTLLK